MKVAIKHDIVLKNGKPNAAIIPYKDFQKLVKLIESISKKQTPKKLKINSDEDELLILKRRKKEKSIPMETFFKKLENA
jgi:PHD/YefM family antitoxin component YafN of YafNO toxin-antitoxin module